MFPCDSLFLEMSIVSGWVSLGDNTKRIKICGVGSTTLDILGPVLHVPDLSFGLISIPTLDKVGCKTVLDGGTVSIFKGSDVILTGSLLDNLYHLDAEYVRALTNLDGNRSTTLRTTPECAHNCWWSGYCDI